MRIVAKRTLREYWEGEPRAENSLRSWQAIAAAADWSSPTDVKAVYARASIVGRDRVVFDIGENRYRLVVRFVGTHAEYDRIDVLTV